MLLKPCVGMAPHCDIFHLNELSTYGYPHPSALVVIRQVEMFCPLDAGLEEMFLRGVLFRML